MKKILELTLRLSFSLTLALGAQRGLAAGAQQVQPWLGVELDATAPETILVKRVIPGAPAERAGFASGDSITAIDKDKVKNRDELMAILRARGVGSKVVVHFKRKGKEETKDLKLEIVPDMLDLAKAQLLNKPAPPFELPSVKDKTIYRNADLKGKVYVLEFWATWCPACRAAAPSLSAWSAKHKDIPILGISDEDPAVIQAFAKREKIGYAQTHDVENKVQSAYGMGSIPAFILIDQKGVVNDLTVGVGEYLETLLQKAETLSKHKS